MNTYRSNKTYRKIYETHYGPIPKDSNGRTLEIHHIDGDHTNNEISNLKLVTIQEHYDIHYSQEDYHACHAIAIRMEYSSTFLSDLAKIVQRNLVNSKNHIFQKNDGPTQQIWTCAHCDTTGKGSSNYYKWHGDNCLILNPNRSCKKTGPKKKKACEYCNILSAPNTFARYHGNNCKFKPQE